MTLVKCLLNAVVSEDARFGTLDIADYCLGADTPEDDVQSLKTCLDDCPSSLLDELGLSDFLQSEKAGKTFVHANIAKTVPGLKNSGLSSQNRLIRHLASSSDTSPPAGITKLPLPRRSATTLVTSPSCS